jgi:hypothetical protein
VRNPVAQLACVFAKNSGAEKASASQNFVPKPTAMRRNLVQ